MFLKIVNNIKSSKRLPKKYIRYCQKNIHYFYFNRLTDLDVKLNKKKPQSATHQENKAFKRMPNYWGVNKS